MTAKCSEIKLKQNFRGREDPLRLRKEKRDWKRLKREDKIIKDVKNLFRLKKEIDDYTIQSIRDLFRLKKENEAIKDRIIKDIRDLFEQEKEDYYKLVRVCNFWSKNYVEDESNGDRNKTPSLEEYCEKLKFRKK